MFLRLFHILTRFALNSIEPFGTKVAENCSHKAKQRKEDSCSFEPPIDHLRSVVEKLTPQFVETAFGLDVGGENCISTRYKLRLFLFGFVATRLDFDTVRLDFCNAGNIDGGRVLRLRGEQTHRYCEHNK